MKFLALYSGRTISSAELVALTANERILNDFAKRLVGDALEAPAPAEQAAPKKRKNEKQVVATN